MNKILYIQASPRIKRSKSLAVADALVEVYKQKNPSDQIISLNLFETQIPSFDGLAVQAKYTILHGQKHSQEELHAWREVEKVIEQFLSADKYILAVPMWNFSIPYRLKQYIDLIVQPGYTFSYTEEQGYQGLVKDKPICVIYARGGEYPAGSDAEVFDLQKKYVELILGFIGFDGIRSIVVEPTLHGGPSITDLKIQSAIEQANEIAVTF